MSLTKYTPQTRDVTVHQRLLDGGLDAARFDWAPLDRAGNAGISVEWLYTADETADGAEACVARYAPGAHEDSHGHLGYELTLVLDGELRDNGDVYPAGTLIAEPPGSVHQFTSPGGCAVLVVREKGVRAVASRARSTQSTHTEVHRCLFSTPGSCGSRLSFQEYVQPGREAVGAYWLYASEQTGPNGAEAYVARFGPGSHGDLHRHLGFELLFVLDGELRNDNGDVYGRGWLVVERPDSVHQVSSEHGCVVLVVREKRTMALAPGERPEDSPFPMSGSPAR
jgi:anti-sigma factor ChrR (cupin superfamily)